MQLDDGSVGGEFEFFWGPKYNYSQIFKQVFMAIIDKKLYFFGQRNHALWGRVFNIEEKGLYFTSHCYQNNTQLHQIPM